MSKTLARQIRRIGKQKLWQPVPDSMAVERVPVMLSSQEYAEKERASRTAWRNRRKANQPTGGNGSIASNSKRTSHNVTLMENENAPSS